MLIIPVYGDKSDHVKELQKALNHFGATPLLAIDGDYGPKTKEAVSKFQLKVGLAGSGNLGSKTIRLLALEEKFTVKPNTKATPWFWFLKRYEGKHETNPEFNKEMSAKWKLVGLDLGTISKNWAAWCGLFIAVGLAGVGYNHQKDGALAKNWDKFGQEINWQLNGFPQGAIIRINNGGKCNSGSGNHVTMANGWCAAKDLMKPGATFSGFGGNQGNAAKVSTYAVNTICSVRWPLEGEPPARVVDSVNCSNGKTSNESTQ